MKVSKPVYFFFLGGPPRIYNELVGQRGRKKEQINL